MNKSRFTTIWVIFMLIDLVLTMIAITGKGADEMNPIAAWIIGIFGFWGLLIYGLTIIFTFGFFVELFYNHAIKVSKGKFKEKHKKKGYDFCIYTIVFLYGYVIINNLKVIMGL